MFKVKIPKLMETHNQEVDHWNFMLQKISISSTMLYQMLSEFLIKSSKHYATNKQMKKKS